MSRSREGSPLKDSYPQSGNTVEGHKEELSYQDHNQKQKQQQQPLSAGIFPEQFHPKDISQHTALKVPLQTSANWVSPKQNDHYSTPQQQQVLAPQRPPSPNNYPLPSSQYADQEPDHHSAGVPSRNVSYEKFIAAEEQQSCPSTTDPKTGFPTSWPKVSHPTPAKVISPPVEQPSPAKVFPPPVKKASPSNVPRTFLPPSPPPPPCPCSCCIIL